MLDIVDLLNEALEKREEAGALEADHNKVLEITRRFPLPS